MEVLNYWKTIHVPCQKFKKEKFGLVFSNVNFKHMELLSSKWKYSLDPSVIPENAFSTSFLTHKPFQVESRHPKMISH